MNPFLTILLTFAWVPCHGVSTCHSHCLDLGLGKETGFKCGWDKHLQALEAGQFQFQFPGVPTGSHGPGGCCGEASGHGCLQLRGSEKGRFHTAFTGVLMCSHVFPCGLMCSHVFRIEIGRPYLIPSPLLVTCTLHLHLPWPNSKVPGTLRCSCLLACFA